YTDVGFRCSLGISGASVPRSPDSSRVVAQTPSATVRKHAHDEGTSGTAPGAVKRPGFGLPRPGRRGFVLLLVSLFLIGGVIAAVVSVRDRSSATAPRPIALTALVQHIKANDVTEIRVSEGDGLATARSGEIVSFTIQPDQPLLKVLASLGAT